MKVRHSIIISDIDTIIFIAAIEKVEFHFIPVNVSVEAVIVGYQLVLSLVVEFALEIHVLQDGQVGLVAGQRDRGHVHQALGAVVVQHL